MARSSYRRRSSRSYKRSYKPSRRSYKPRKSLKRYVKRAIAKTEEIKRQHYAAYSIDINSYITDAECHLISPALSQGTGQGDRIGNAINIKKVILRITAIPFAASTYGDLPQSYDVYVFRNRTSNTVAAADMGRFLQAGNSATDYDGTNLHSLFSVNNDKFKLFKHKRFRMGNVFTTQNQTGTSGPRYKNYTLDITNCFKKRQVFSDNLAATPTNDNVYLAIGGNFPTNDGLAGSQHMADYNLNVEYFYTDA